ncbi:MAG: FkbM family methyltransferase [Planctomycetota bacterium]
MSLLDSLRDNSLARTLLAPAIAMRRSRIRRSMALATQVVAHVREQMVVDPVMRVDEFGGEFVIDRRSDLFRRLCLDGVYEPGLVGMIRAHLPADRDMIDVGANIGFYSVLFAKHLGEGRRVLAVEPTSNALGRLRANLDRNGVVDRVDIFEGVASSEVGEIEIRTIPGREEYSSVGELEHPSIGDSEFVTERVNSRPLDQLVEERGLNPGFIKIDVEGVEHLVLAGAEHVLREHRPVVLSELSDRLLRKNGSSGPEVVAVFERNGYTVFDADNPKTKPGHRPLGDVVAFPKELGVSL